MGLRTDLQVLLEELLETPRVYFQPPASMRMEYPCIVYQLDDIRTEFAGNNPYIYTKRYQVSFIDTNPDNPVRDKLIWLPSSVFDRYYVANNLHHSVFTLYF